MIAERLADHPSTLEAHIALRSDGLAFLKLHRAFDIERDARLTRLDFAFGSSKGVDKSFQCHINFEQGMSRQAVAKGLRDIASMLDGAPDA